MSAFYRVISLVLFMQLTASAQGQDLQAQVMAWNVESGDADPTVMAQQIPHKGNMDLWGLSEVHNQQWLDVFSGTLERGWEVPYRTILGSTRNADKLAILYRDNVFEALGKAFEFVWIERTVKVKIQASHFNSTLDYILVANTVGFWQAELAIIQREDREPIAAADNHHFSRWSTANESSACVGGFRLNKANFIR